MIQTKQIDSIEPGNPFLSDLYHMGSSIGSNVVVMYGQHTRERQPYIIVCNTETGERLQIDFDPSAPGEIRSSARILQRRSKGASRERAGHG